MTGVLDETVGKKPVPEALSMGRILALGQYYTDPQERALFYFCYLTGARISEALASRVNDISASSSEALGEFLVVKLVTLKNRRVPLRNVPVPMKHMERPMVNAISDYVVSRGMDGSDRPLFSFSRTNAWNRLSKIEFTVRALDKNRKEIISDYTRPINPHYLRHCRLTHLVQHYDFNEIQLMRFAGWTNSKPAIIYVHLNWLDLAKVMSQAQEYGSELW